ncbi:tetratricopeptide repeat protein [Prosthecobacter sp.]|uniref:tetratricopeptide repeat protein n=1 Tax=Prosthecobacter sp. TaxID=1965333 RepID=UPI002ABD07E2|nr:tetratricopeptide repeat protein [Prosthecobacter sp.]MDZ4401103.1 tetratricopeptide repeat protein [Prosthecobacter sp.]
MSETPAQPSAPDFDSAIQAARVVVEAQREAVKEYPGKAPALVRALQVLGDAQREAGDTDGAEATYLEALEAGAKLELPAEAIANVRTSLATLLDFSGRETESLPYYEEAINNHEALGGENLEVAAQLRNNLAMTYKCLGKFALAEQHYLRALETLENKRGRESESVACVYNNLGSLYYAAGFPDQAKEMFEDGLKIRIKVLGNKHRDVAQSYCNLGTACHELGENAAAQQHFETSLGVLESQLPAEAASYEAIGQDYIAMLDIIGEEGKAAAFQKRLEKTLTTV